MFPTPDTQKPRMRRGLGEVGGKLIEAGLAEAWRRVWQGGGM